MKWQYVILESLFFSKLEFLKSSVSPLAGPSEVCLHHHSILSINQKVLLSFDSEIYFLYVAFVHGFMERSDRAKTSKMHRIRVL